MEIISAFVRVSQSSIVNLPSISGINLEWDMNNKTVMIDVSISTAGSESYGLRLHILKYESETCPDGDMLIEKLYEEEHLDKTCKFIYETLISGELVSSEKSLLEVTEEWLIKSGEKDRLVEVIKEASRL